MLEDKEACAEKSKSQKEEEVLLLLDLPVEVINILCCQKQLFIVCLFTSPIISCLTT